MEKDEKGGSKQNFGKTILNYIDRGVEASKKGLKSAGNALSEFGDKSVLKIELSQLKSQLAKNYTELGKTCYKILRGDNQGEFSAGNAEIVKLLDAVEKTEENIAKHEEALKKPKESKVKDAPINGSPEEASVETPSEPPSETENQSESDVN